MEETYSDYPETMTKRFRVKCYAFNFPNEIISLAYYDTYDSAYTEFKRICEDDEFNRLLDKKLTIELSETIVGAYVPILIQTYIQS